MGGFNNSHLGSWALCFCHEVLSSFRWFLYQKQLHRNPAVQLAWKTCSAFLDCILRASGLWLPHPLCSGWSLGLWILPNHNNRQLSVQEGQWLSEFEMNKTSPELQAVCGMNPLVWLSFSDRRDILLCLQKDFYEPDVQLTLYFVTLERTLSTWARARRRENV